MSTIKVTNIEHASTANGGIQLDNAGHVTVDGQQMPTAGPLGNRNLIINGAMNVAQRATSKTGLTLSDYPTVDRMILALSNCGTWTATQESEGPAGFAKSFKMLCTTADASPAASDFAVFQYIIEAQDLQHLNYGTSDAVPITVSFWVKSNKTGNASFGTMQFDGFRTFSKQYEIQAQNTWEYKTITIPADASGRIDDDNDKGLLIEWWCNSGSDFTGGTHPTTWTANDNTDRNATNIGIGQAVNDYLQITGIQVEVGEKATPFEHKSYGDEFARCQRYFQKHHEPRLRGVAGTSTALNRLGMTLPVKMRQNPTVSSTGTFGWYDGSNIGQINYFTTSYLTEDSVELDSSNSTTNPNAMTGNTAISNPLVVYNSGTTHAGELILNAEL